MQYLVGNDTLAGVLYPDEVMKSLVKGDQNGIFFTTFKNKRGKDARGLVKKIVKKSVLAELVTHLAPFDKSHAYPIKKLEKQVLADTKVCQGIAKLGSTKLLLSPFCENKHKRKDIEPLFKKMMALAPDCLFVNSIYGGEEVPGIITEIHIPNSKKLPPIPKQEFIISFDGFGGDGSGDFPDADIYKIILYYAKSGRLRAVRGWNFRHNGKYGHADTAPINNRTCLPNVVYLLGTRATLMPREGSKWDDKKLYKSFADDHGNPINKTKDCRAMVILPNVTKKTVQVYDMNGNNIAQMSDQNLPPHTGKPKGKRFYSHLFACELAEMAHINTGSYLIRIEDEPPIDGRLRSGLLK